MTDSKASMLMRWKIASRRIPALLPTPSSLPKLSIAVLTILLAGIASATVSKFATAVPPRFLISSTTSSAGEALEPEPSAAPPGSLTKTFAPSARQSRAISLPLPRPAQEEMMGVPSSDFVMVCLSRQSGRCDSIELWCAIAHLRISRFRVWSFGPSRNDDGCVLHPRLRLPDRLPDLHRRQRCGQGLDAEFAQGVHHAVG